ncbi:MAG TPA: biotin--[acetyl-CoA-carboxylase] ligase [Candidatus Dormibacteraeota bacterium]|nr:biotin--[acetyl-CoA-carboxylase] ligase [Candidatus Dormibacteraeota bacterium]
MSDRLALLRDPSVRGAFASALGTERVGREIDYHDVIATTMTRGEELIRSGAPDGTVVVADHQTEGRGRRGRQWGYGGAGTQLLASWLLRVDTARAPLVSVLASVAALRASRSLGVERLSVKWPNDLLLDGRKTAGVLAIGVRDAGGTDWLDLGMGIDIHTRDHPEEVRGTVTSFAREGYDVDRLALLARLATEIERIVDADASARAAAMDEWRRASATLGRRIRVQDGAREFEADAVELADDGALLVRRGGQLERVVAGDVSVRPG